MLGKLRAQFTSGIGAAVSAPETRALQAALAELAPPWQILRNRRIRSADGPPWAKFIAFHPEKGIALIDLLPGNPREAIDPLDEFLARTGWAAFSAGDPPIVAVAVAADHVDRVEPMLNQAFAAGPPCGIKNGEWPDAVIQLLLSTRGLLLARVAKETVPALPPPANTAEITAATALGRSSPSLPADQAQPIAAALPASKGVHSATDAAPSLPEIALAAGDPPKAEMLPIPLGEHDATDAAKQQRRFSFTAIERPQPMAPSLEESRPRYLWIAPAALTLLLILGAIGLVDANWPRPQPALVADAQNAPRAGKRPAAAAPAPADLAQDLSNNAAPPAEAPVPTARGKRRLSSSPVPIWEEQQRPGRNGRPRGSMERRQRTPEELLTALNAWFNDQFRR